MSFWFRRREFRKRSSETNDRWSDSRRKEEAFQLLVAPSSLFLQGKFLRESACRRGLERERERYAEILKPWILGFDTTGWLFKNEKEKWFSERWNDGSPTVLPTASFYFEIGNSANVRLVRSSLAKIEYYHGDK